MEGMGERVHSPEYVRSYSTSCLPKRNPHHVHTTSPVSPRWKQVPLESTHPAGSAQPGRTQRPSRPPRPASRLGLGGRARRHLARTTSAPKSTVRMTTNFQKLRRQGKKEREKKKEKEEGEGRRKYISELYSRKKGKRQGKRGHVRSSIVSM